MWGKKIIILFFCFVLAITVFAQDTLAYWNFSETSGTITKEYISNSNYSIHSKRPAIERVTGIRDNTLRTDGNTDYVDSVNTKTKILSQYIYMNCKFRPSSEIELTNYIKSK